MRKPRVPPELKKKGSAMRKRLSFAIAEIKKRDYGHGFMPYNPNRSLEETPFGRELAESLKARLRSGKGTISVLDKGAGTGRIAAELKALDPKRVKVTALSLSDCFDKKYRRSIDKPKLGVGFRMNHGQRFDFIFDSYGEDYHLGKDLVLYSIRKSLFDLNLGGELFTVLPLYYTEKIGNLTVEDGKRLLAKLSAEKGVSVRTEEIQRRFDRVEFVDLVVRAKRRR